MTTKRHQRGAALIVALAILVVLLALAITFLTTSRLELQVATNVEEQLRTELLANGGLAIAIAFLQHDLITHPTYTSLDHAWKTYFNGAWAAGKPWMFPDGRRLWNTFGEDFTGDGQPDPLGPGVPIVSLTALAQNFPRTDDGRPVYDTELTNDWLYMPVATGNPLVLFPPIDRNFSGPMQFVRDEFGFYVISEQVAADPSILGPDIPPFIDPIANAPRPRLASELTDIWADVDNTGDGIKDAMWIPVPQDVDFSNDGIDNDLNGVIDNPGEIARFLYWDPQLERLLLTAPLVANGIPVLNNVNMLEAGAVDPVRLAERYVIAGERMQELLGDAGRWTVTSNYGHPSVDRRDNDHDFLEGNARTVDLSQELDPANPTFLGQVIIDGYNPFDFAELRDLFPIHPRYTGVSPLIDADGNDLPFIYSSGEPVTEIVGRLAITITDTASRVDIGAIGGFARDATLSTAPAPFSRVRAINQGVSPFEYEPRVLPAFGPARTEKLWNLTVGAPFGVTTERMNADRVAQGLAPLPSLPYGPQYDFDIRHPGYGLTDDNANALSLAMDGIDNDGTGLIDPVFSLGSPADPPAVRLRYFASFGQPLALEGIDEPAEYQRYRPLRNRLAESDGVDNTPPIAFTFDDGTVTGWGNVPGQPSIVDGVGELGDLVLRSKEQIKQIVENEQFVSGQRLYDIIRNHTTVHATQRTERRRYTNAFGQTQGLDLRPVPERGDITGTKLDLNYASVEQIYTALTEDFGFPSMYEEFLASLNRPDAPRREDFVSFNDFRRAQLLFMQTVADRPLFALGLGVEALDMLNTRPSLDRDIRLDQFGRIARGFTADDRLRAAQLAVNIADFRDSDHNRTTFTFTVPDLWWELAQRQRGVPDDFIETRELEYTVAGIESIRINEIMARPARRVEAEMLWGVGSAPAGMLYPGSPLDFDTDLLPLPRVTSPRYLTVDESLIGDPQFAIIRQAGNYDPPGPTAATFQLTGQGYIATLESIFTNFNPNYFSVIPGTIPGNGVYANVDPAYRAQGFPDFRMTQRFFAWWTGAPLFVDINGEPATALDGVLNDPAVVFNPVQLDVVDLLGNPTDALGIALSAQAAGGWERIWSKERVIGENTALFTRRGLINRPSLGLTVVPNFAEFEFLPSPGLPPGRYYLKLNTAMLMDSDGNPATPDNPDAFLFATVRDGDQHIHFAIKYDLPGRGFIADVSQLLLSGVPLAAPSFLDTLRDNPMTAIAPRDLIVDGLPLRDPAQLGIPDDGTVFLPVSDDDFNFRAAGRLVELAVNGVIDDSILPRYDPQGSFTVTIPAYTDNLALHIAVWRGDGLAGDAPFAVNYFEFSQEPAHEWLEIVNIAEDGNPIDLSGWVLEVGHPEDERFQRTLDGELLTYETLRRRFRVPDDTLIAPGGKLLLGFSKFDFLGADNAAVPAEVRFPSSLFASQVPPINRNGMALANTGFLPNPINLPNGAVPGLTPNLPEPTVPPIPMGDPRFADPVFWPMGPPIGTPGSALDGVIGGISPDHPGSVFRRVLFLDDELIPFSLRDFVDLSGDGLDDQRSGQLDATLALDPAVRLEELGASYAVASTRFDTLPIASAAAGDTGSGPNKPFDRIVQLEAIDGTESRLPLFDISPGGFSADDVAKTILAGGVFPTYPERDGRDNNLSNDRLLADGFNTDLNSNNFLEPNQGIDQGAPPGFLIPGTTRRAPQPGSYSFFTVPYQGWFTNFPTQTFIGDGQGGIPPGANELIDIMVGNRIEDTPEFKNFLERRWNPGDVVMVTLYTGRPSEERVADRVTYTERDIVNRSIHDGIACPYQRLIRDETTGQPTLLLTTTLNRDFPTMWPDDTMGVDFYRSLERKHPMYTGDRFGLIHRWTATDGNYDDWDAGWGKKDADIRVNPLTGAIQGVWLPENSPPATLGLRMRWTGFVGIDPRLDIMVGHQLEASPLRMNMAARQFENPVTSPLLPGSPVAPELSPRQLRYATVSNTSFLARDPYALALGLDAELGSTNFLKRWTWHKPRVRNSALTSAGDLMSMPGMTLRRRQWRGDVVSGIGGVPGGFFNIETFGREPFGLYNDTVAGVVLGERRKNDITALTGISLMEPKVLTAGQANVYFLTPRPSDGPQGEFPQLDGFNVTRGAENEVVPGETWPSGTVLTSPESYPRNWTPVLLYSLPGDMIGEALYQPFRLAPTVGGPPAANLPARTNFLMDTARSPADVNFFFRGPMEGGFGPGQDPIPHLVSRSTKRSRVAFWASANLPGVDRHALDTPAAGAITPPAEVLFEWDGDSGLENGDYEVYIITAEPLDGLAQYRDRLLNNPFATIDEAVSVTGGTEGEWESRIRRLAEVLTPTALAVLQQAENTVPSSLPVDVEILTDRTGNRRVWPGLYPEPRDFRAGGQIDGEAINPESAGLLKRVTPDSQGVIHYGAVRVENNYLALRLRNWAAPGRLNRFSRVVLTPVNRVRGRININTVATVRDTNDLGNAPGPLLSGAAGLPYPSFEEVAGLPLFNPLQGLPGVLTASYDETRPFADGSSPLERLRLNEQVFSPRSANMTYPNLLGVDQPVLNMYDRSISLADRIVQHRPDWGDGRYYRYPSDLVAWEQRVPWPDEFHIVPPWASEIRPLLRAVPYANEFPHYASEAITAIPPSDPFAPGPPLTGLLDSALNDATLYLVDPLRAVHEYKVLTPGVPITQQEQYVMNNARFNESRYRFSRMANNVTTRSDVFEIIVTAQSGYVPASGERREAAINYRNEFIVQGEQKIRVIYER